MNITIDQICNKYPKTNSEIIREFLQYIYDSTVINKIYIGGAITFNRIDEYSDLDIHCVVGNGKMNSFKKLIYAYVRKKKTKVFYCIKDRNFPWFGELTTIYFNLIPVFYVDIGCIEEIESSTFYFQYNGKILKDKNNHLHKEVLSVRRKEKLKVKKLLQYHKDQVVTTSVKIEKDIKRGLYWNSIENLAQLRRAFIFLYSYENYYSAKFPFIGRVERDIEYTWNSKDLKLLDKSIPDKDLKSVASAFKYLTMQLSKLKSVQNDSDILYFIKQLTKR